jgi:uncharacterized protein (TIGR00661 family)
MMRIYIGVYGVGLGHASRMLLLADRLKEEGCLLEFSSFGDAVVYIRNNGFKCNIVPEVEFGWHPSIGFNVKRSIMNIPINGFNFSKQLMLEISNMKRFRPDVVVSDTRLSTLFAARILGIRCIVILNQIKLLLSPRLREFAVVRLFEDMLAEVLAVLWRRGDSIIAPDLPPPYTISEQNLWHIKGMDNILKYSGFIIPKREIDEYNMERICSMLELSNNSNNSNSKPIIFIHISGPKQTKLYIVRRLLEGIGDGVKVIVSEGKPDGSIVPKRIRNGWYFEWCPFKDEVFAMSNVIVMRAGHSTIAQAIKQGKPMVCIPIENHSEQLGNAIKVAKLGIGVMLREKGLDTKKVNHAIDEVLNDSKYMVNMKNVKSIADRSDGIEYIVRDIL